MSTLRTTLDQSIETMERLAHVPPTSLSLLSSNLELVKQWGRLQRIFLFFSSKNPCQHLDPLVSIQQFKDRMNHILTSSKYTPDMHHTCKKAAEIFTGLILRTNAKAPATKRIAEEELHTLLDFSVLEKSHGGSKPPLASPSDQWRIQSQQPIEEPVAKSVDSVQRSSVDAALSALAPCARQHSPAHDVLRRPVVRKKQDERVFPRPFHMVLRSRTRMPDSAPKK